MLRWDLTKRLEKTGWNAHQFAAAAGIGYPAAWRLMLDPEAIVEHRLDVQLAEKIARALGVKSPWRLFVWTPDTPTPSAPHR